MKRASRTPPILSVLSKKMTVFLKKLPIKLLIPRNYHFFHFFSKFFDLKQNNGVPGEVETGELS